MSESEPTPTHMVSIRIRLGGVGYLGPGKVRLMELIREHGSISGAGRAMGMSYRRAWVLTDELNNLFTAPVILKHAGGFRGGGAALTDLGKDVVKLYRSIERKLAKAAAKDLEKLRVATKIVERA